MLSKTHVLVIGHNGMLGHTVNKVLSFNNDIIVETLRDFKYPRDSVNYGNRYKYIINCVGTVKPQINESDPTSVLNAINTNTLLPHILAGQNKNSKIIHATTDCVFDGSDQFYNENFSSNAKDIYGKSKALGEVRAENFVNLRVSIIGFEKGGNKRSLVEWFNNLSEGAEINGWTCAMWNGISTYAWAKIVNGIINSPDLKLPGTIHVVPYDVVSKYRLLNILRDATGRKDIIITPVEGECVDRTLSTIHLETNEALWNIAGYAKIPTIEELIYEMVSNR